MTLVEILVAVAILSILVLILAQILGLVSFSWAVGRQRMDNLTKARAFLDLIARDVQDGIFRPDLAAFRDQNNKVASKDSTSYAFYSKRTGGGNGNRSLALLNYQLYQTSTSCSLMRGALPTTWTSALPPFAGPSAGTGTIGFPELLSNLVPIKPTNLNYYSEVASGVVAFKLYFINSNPAGSPPAPSYSLDYLPGNYNNMGSAPMTIAVGVTIVVLDSQTQQLMASQNTLSGLIGNTNFIVSGSLPGSLKDAWDANINTPGFFAAYPQQLRTGLKVFERVIQIPSYH